MTPNEKETAVHEAAIKAMLKRLGETQKLLDSAAKELGRTIIWDKPGAASPAERVSFALKINTAVAEELTKCHQDLIILNTLSASGAYGREC